jgi:hypothetical protein
LAINVAKELQIKYKNKINFLIATSPIFGFKNNDEEGRWEVYKEASKKSDILG